MSDDKNKDNPSTDELTAEIRRGRHFTLSEAIGRAAGDSLKGASPVPATDQLVWQISQLLATDLDDSEGSLSRTILARLADEPPLLAAHRNDPAGALAAFLDRVLATTSSLAELVRQTDARWGRDYDERPHFERDGQPPHSEDPYTVAGVQTELTRLRHALNR